MTHDPKADLVIRSSELYHRPPRPQSPPPHRSRPRPLFMPKYVHMTLAKSALAALLLAAATIAQNPPALKQAPSFDLGAIDRASNPCDDFYQYACGTWLKNNPIPPDQSSWGRFSELDERNRTILRQILEKAETAANRGRRHAEDRRLLRLLHG